MGDAGDLAKLDCCMRGCGSGEMRWAGSISRGWAKKKTRNMPCLFAEEPGLEPGIA
jgi:hypothetical protein